MPKHRTALVAISWLVIAIAVSMAAGGVMAAELQDKRWEAVAPGRVEPCSGQIKIATIATGVVDKVLVKANDKVFAGEPLIHLADGELAARLAAAETQVALRQRARDARSVTGSANARRKARDAVADAELAVYGVRAIVDQAAAEWRAKGGPDDSLTTARSALARAQAELTKRQEELRTIEEDSPLPTILEGQLSIARSEYSVARSALDNMTLRAPIDGTVLQVNVRAGELVSPGSPQPPLQIADLSALCVRAELDERDLGSVKVKQPVSVQASAFPGREFEGIVSSVAPLVERGRLEPPGSRNQSDVDVVAVMVELTGSGELTVGMKADVYFRSDK
jgi:HlyD family secretion protein